jgi:two-component system response regulator GlrR
VEVVMLQRRIIIPADREGEPVGAQIKAILDPDAHYRVAVVDFNESIETVTELIVPVLPASIKKAKSVLAELHRRNVGVPILPVVKSETLNQIENISSWKDDFLLTPIREPEVRTRVRRILGSNEEQTADPARAVPADGDELTQLVGEAPSFVAVKKTIPRIAQSERTVLIVGETGTGKELCARALHYLSPRADKPFIPLNCGAIPSDLFERELFGNHKGAFTSAWTAQPGFLDEAENGTLFLDEIEALPCLAQVKLLRFLQDQTYSMLGSPKLKKANVRIIASTNVDLSRKIRDGTFREDLFYRLAVLILNLPPLRERSGDVSLLANHFWSMYADTNGITTPRRLSPGALDALKLYSWPGNVRELENVIHRIVVLSEDDLIEPKDLPIPVPLNSSQSISHKEAKARAIEHFERTYIAELLHKHNGNVTQAAREAKKDRRALGRLIKKYRVPKYGSVLSHAWDKE